MYDVALTGIDDEGNKVAVPFLFGIGSELPYIRESNNPVREQVDFSPEPGEQSFQNWWYRSQSSFDLGAGVEFNDTSKDQYLSRRFNDSQGIDPFTPGQVSLIKQSDKHASNSGRAFVSGYSTSGEEGVIYGYNNSGNVVMKKINSSGTVSSDFATGTGTLFDISTDGGYGFSVTANGIYRWDLPNTGYTKIYDCTPSRAKIGYVKQRLMACLGSKVYELNVSPSSPPASLPTAKYEHPQAGWVWSDISEGPEAIYISGYAGDQSSIYAITITENSSGVPVLSTPFVVASLPRGEVIYSLFSYMGTYLAIGTSSGLRVSTIEQGGSLNIGPLTLKSDTPVKAITGYKDHLYCGGARILKRTGLETYTTMTGLYKVDLSKPIPTQSGSNSGKFAYATNLHTGSAVSENIYGVCMVGQTGRVSYTVCDDGVYTENDTIYINTGWIKTGKIRLDTWEDKVFEFLRVTNSATDGDIEAIWLDENGNETSLYAWDTDSVSRVDTFGSDGEKHLFVQYLFKLGRGDINTKTPILTGYQVKAQPAQIKERTIQLPLLCFKSEKPIKGYKTERSTWERIRYLENAEKKGGIIRYQNLGTGENTYAMIENIQFISNQTPQSRADQAEPGGMLVVTLRTVS